MRGVDNSTKGNITCCLFSDFWLKEKPKTIHFSIPKINLQQTVFTLPLNIKKQKPQAIFKKDHLWLLLLFNHAINSS